MSIYQASVIIATYNPDLKKLYRTIRSIVFQEGVEHEIIITDDGSSMDFCQQIEDYFRVLEYQSYRILRHDKNVGTVNNVYDAIRYAKFENIKLISPGDYFYQNNSLHAWLAYMSRMNSDICFAKIIPYFENDKGQFCIDNQFRKPNNDTVYCKKYNQRSFLVNMGLISNTPVGASYLGKKELYLNYLPKIIDIVKYAEDFIYRLMLLDGIKIDYFQQYGIWYEVGSGISTSKQMEWGKRLKKDEDSLYMLIRRTKYEGEGKRFAKLVRFRKKAIFKLMEALYYPEYLFWVILRKIDRNPLSMPIEQCFLIKVSSSDY